MCQKTYIRCLSLVTLIILCCVPAWLLSVFYLQGMLVFLVWV